MRFTYLQIAETTGSVLDDFGHAVEAVSACVCQTCIDESDDTLVVVA